jgi:hypothetical protein
MSARKSFTAGGKPGNWTGPAMEAFYLAFQPYGGDIKNVVF